MHPDLWGQEQVRAHLRTPILQSARAHISRAVSLRDTVYETLSDSPPKQGAPEATSTIALSFRMVLTPHSRLACWLAAWLASLAGGSIILDGLDGVHPQLSLRASLQVQGARAKSKRLDGSTATGAGRAPAATVPSLQPTGWTEDRSPGSRTR